MPGLRLSDYESGLLTGSHGEGARLAIQIIVEYAQALGAVELLPITRAHIDGCLYHGESGLDFAQKLTDGGAAVVVDTTLNVGGVDLIHPHLNLGDPKRAEQASKLMRLYENMGCRPTWTCAPYQLVSRPTFGEHVAWAESNAVVFINSVVGARSERYGDFIDICAALTARVPKHGLHITENRRGEEIFDVSDLPPEWEETALFWPLLGLIVGRAVGKRVPVVTGVRRRPTEDDLKAFGAAAAAAGSVALYHVVGFTAEAPNLDAALQGESPSRVVPVTGAMLREGAATIDSRGGGILAAVSVGTPHFSLSEFGQLVTCIDGRRRNSQVEFYVSTSRVTLEEVARRGWLDLLTAFGAEVVVDTCTYFAPIIRNPSGLVMTNSAKWAYYAPGNIGAKVVLGTLSDCASSAVLGKVVRGSLPPG